MNGVSNITLGPPVFKLNEIDIDTWGYLQTWMYTGELFDRARGQPMPDFEHLLKVWICACRLQMPGVKPRAIHLMCERRKRFCENPGMVWLAQAASLTERLEPAGVFSQLVTNFSVEYMRYSTKDHRELFAVMLSPNFLARVRIANARGGYRLMALARGQTLQ